MSRLVHSEAGFLRAIQMSTTKVFAFVEGGLDRNFYDRVLAQRCGLDFPYEVYAAKELPGNTGGKQPLITLHTTLKSQGKLSCVAFGKKYVCLFFADKDIDEVTEDVIHCENFLYTETYDLEGHLISCGDLKRAIADAAHLTYKQASNAVGDQNDFIKNLTKDWIDWLVVCIISQIHKVNFGCSFERALPIEKKNDFSWQDENSKLAIIKNKICVATGMTARQYSTKQKKFEKLIHKEMTSGNILKYFKGKWFKQLLQEFAKKKLDIEDAVTDGLFEGVLKTLVCQVPAEINCRCCGPVNEAIEKLISELQP